MRLDTKMVDTEYSAMISSRIVEYSKLPGEEEIMGVVSVQLRKQVFSSMLLKSLRDLPEASQSPIDLSMKCVLLPSAQA